MPEDLVVTAFWEDSEVQDLLKSFFKRHLGDRESLERLVHLRSQVERQVREAIAEVEQDEHETALGAC